MRHAMDKSPDDFRREMRTSLFRLLSARLSLPDNATKYFCDRLHQTEAGYELTARILADSWDQLDGSNANNQTVWITGGSTTEGYVCDGTNGWPEKLAKLRPDKIAKAVNLAKGGENSDYSITTLEARLLHEERPPDMVIFSDWFNEDQHYFDRRDRNYERLKGSFPERMSETGESKITLRDSPLRLEATLFEHSLLYFTFKTFLHKTLQQQTSRSATESLCQAADDSGMDSAEPRLSYHVRNYELNIQRLAELGAEYGFRVALIRLPYIEKYCSGRETGYARFSMAFNPVMDALARRHGFRMFDVNAIYQAEILRASKIMSK